MPGGGQRASFRFAIADDAGDDQFRIIKHRAKSVRQGIAQFAALMDGAGGLRRHMAGNPAGERELLEEPLDARRILGDIGIRLGIGAFQIGIGH